MKAEGKGAFSGDLEDQYQLELGPEKVRNARMAIILINILNVSFAFLDLLALPSNVTGAWIIRLLMSATVTPIFFVTGRPVFLRYYTAWVYLLISLVGAGLNGLISIATPEDVARDVYYGGLLLLTISIYTLFYQRHLHAFLLGGSLVVSYALVATVWHDYLGPPQLPTLLANLSFLISMVFLGLVAQIGRDRLTRDNFLLRHLLQKDARAQAEAARQAQWQADHDPLTGLPNRLQLERAAARLLDDATRSRELIAIAYVDLDNF
jgi:predicted signal transduction protein with EAL and GGDEF domain